MTAAGHWGRIAVVSPHLDDGVFSCGELLAAHPGATVITVFSGIPPGDPVTPWDAACGFRGAREAMMQRRLEDRAALGVLRARPSWLDFRDSQYAVPTSVDAVAGRLRAVLADVRPDAVFVPLGLFHSDHDLAHRAALRLVGHGRARWLGYEDALYRAIPGLLDDRLRRLAGDGIPVTPAGWEPPGAQHLKRRAVNCYASQLKGLAGPGRPGHADTALSERYWNLMAAPA